MIDTKMKGIQSQSCLSSEKVLQFDSFGSQINLNYENGSESYRSATGSCLSILLYFLTLVYAIQNLQILLGYKGSTFSTSTNVSYHDSSFIFSEEKGFQMAFAVADPSDPDGKFNFEEYYDVRVRQYTYDANSLG